jgi:hypothetical protein
MRIDGRWGVCKWCVCMVSHGHLCLLAPQPVCLDSLDHLPDRRTTERTIVARSAMITHRRVNSHRSTNNTRAARTRAAHTRGTRVWGRVPVVFEGDAKQERPCGVLGDVLHDLSPAHHECRIVPAVGRGEPPHTHTHTHAHHRTRAREGVQPLPLAQKCINREGGLSLLA